MIVNPRIGQRVRIHYRAAVSVHMPYHAHIGIVRIRGRGRPRNHGIEIDGQIISVPCGNLQREKSEKGG